MTPVRIGCVRYLNTLPLIEGLRTWAPAGGEGGCELITAVPSALIGKLQSHEVDIALCSIIDAASASPAPSVLPVGMIGCDGPTLTVRVFSKKPIAEVDEFAVDSDSHTSVVLLRVLMWKLHGKKITVRERSFPTSPGREATKPRSHEGAEQAILLIGDKVVTDAPSDRDYPHTLDLGAAWKQLTGLPFVYAVWMCRAGEEDSLPIRAAAAMLDRTRRHNATRLDCIVASRASEKGWPDDLAAKYLGSSLTYAVQEPEREAAEKFLRWAAELGIGSGTIRWAD